MDVGWWILIKVLPGTGSPKFYFTQAPLMAIQCSFESNQLDCNQLISQEV